MGNWNISAYYTAYSYLLSSSTRRLVGLQFLPFQSQSLYLFLPYSFLDIVHIFLSWPFPYTKFLHQTKWRTRFDVINNWPTIPLLVSTIVFYSILKLPVLIKTFSFITLLSIISLVAFVNTTSLKSQAFIQFVFLKVKISAP